ncbi:FAD-dependent oxidoreductase [Leptolyngbya sp. AN02str]|uniref:FAD-dependent oxidoreductase n=1 Tax=Leptolyngbya sp. AN02str TaxID=3423363 RepID=UPI003D31DCFC
MPVDYDLVIIGGTLAAREAAIAAAGLRAQVALVEPPNQDRGLDADLCLRLWQQVGQQQRQANRVEPFKGNLLPKPERSTPEQISQSWSQGMAWAQTIADTLAEERSLEVLSAQGVDVRVGRGEFVRRPNVGFVVEGHLLRSRAYLLANQRTTPQLDLPGLPGVSPLTPETLVTLGQLQRLPRRLLILGGDSRAVAWAQALVRIGIEATVICPSRMLPNEDPELAALMQAVLEADGVHVLSHTPIDAAEAQAQQVVVQAHGRSLKGDHILITAPPQLDQTGLNLAGIGLESLTVTSKLKTRHPRVYALSGDSQHAQFEAAIAIKNALFLPLWRLQPQWMPNIVRTDPPLARVGLTAAQAQQQWGKAVSSIALPLKQVPKAQLRAETTGLSKFVVHRNGQILGAHILAPEAEEWIGTIALAMQTRQPLPKLAKGAIASSSVAAILYEAERVWRMQLLHQHPRVLDALDSGFDWLRSRDH